MSLVGDMISDNRGHDPSIVNYSMFVAVFSMLSLFYLFAVTYNEGFAGHPALPLALDALNVLFFFCAAIALAAELGVKSCSNSVRKPWNVLVDTQTNTFLELHCHQQSH